MPPVPTGQRSLSTPGNGRTQICHSPDSLVVGDPLAIGGNGRPGLGVRFGEQGFGVRSPSGSSIQMSELVSGLSSVITRSPSFVQEYTPCRFGLEVRRSTVPAWERDMGGQDYIVAGSNGSLFRPTVAFAGIGCGLAATETGRMSWASDAR